jgi:hypothetical protein
MRPPSEENAMFSTVTDTAAYANAVRRSVAVKNTIKTAALVGVLVFVYKYDRKSEKNSTTTND